jgi:phage/plasmid-associated DNA primase
MTQKTKTEEQKSLDISHISRSIRVARFKGTTLYLSPEGYWQPLNEDHFRTVAYASLTAPSKSRIAEVWDYMQYATPDLTPYAQYIRMGDLVWDTVAVDFSQTVPAEDCVYATSITPVIDPEPSEFVLALANGNEGVYKDILQTIAPIFTHHKPAGVIWWKGEGRNGKTTLTQVLYDLFPGFISGLTIKQIEDERDAPALNGNLANIVKESSEGYISDSKAYKSIGTHESFPVHKFHSQQSVMIDGSLHHIFSANNIPVFGDKSEGAKRRTLLIPFEARFEDDPTFTERMFTPDFYAQHLGLFLQYAKRLKDQSYHYFFSHQANRVKERYDDETNTAATYIDEILEQQILGFDGYGALYNSYQNWCIDNGYTASGRQHLRRATETRGFHATTTREGDKHLKHYVHEDITFSDLVHVGGLYLGLYRSADATSALIEQAQTQSPIQEFLDAIPN